jgi:hypothetical protein
MMIIDCSGQNTKQHWKIVDEVGACGLLFEPHCTRAVLFQKRTLLGSLLLSVIKIKQARL